MKLNKIAFGILALSVLTTPALADEMMDHSKMDHSAHEGAAPCEILRVYYRPPNGYYSSN